MNKARRKALGDIIAKLEAMEELRTGIQELLDEVMSEETEALENMPESLQESERGQQMQDYIDTMDSAIGDLDAIDVESIMEQLQEIVDG